MKKIDSVTYDVKQKENITINVTPTNFDDSLSSVDAELDGKGLTNVGTDDAPVFRFSITKSVGKTHRVIMEFNFIAGTPDNSFYQVDISGQNDVGCPCGFTVAKSDNVKEVGIRFRVKA